MRHTLWPLEHPASASGAIEPAPRAHLQLQGRVLPASAMALCLEWAGFANWVDEQRQFALRRLDEEIEAERALRLAALVEEIAAEREQRQQDLGMVQLRALQQLKRSLDEWCERLAGEAADVIAQSVAHERNSAAKLLASGLSGLLEGAGGGVALSIHCAAEDLDHVHAALAELPTAAFMHAAVSTAPEVVPGQCLIRVGDQSYEYNLAEWIERLHADCLADCRELVAALGLQFLPLDTDASGAPNRTPMHELAATDVDAVDIDWPADQTDLGDGFDDPGPLEGDEDFDDLGLPEEGLETIETGDEGLADAELGEMHDPDEPVVGARRLR